MSSPSSPATRRAIVVAAEEWAAIRLFAMDVDGVLTDGTIFISSDGSESKQFSILDGMGLVRMQKAGVHLAWISGRQSTATTVRAAELKIPHLIQGRLDKLSELRALASQLNLAPKQCCYMGDDDIDAPAIRWAGIGVSVIDGMPAALDAARFIPARHAGRGAVREVCDHILAASQPAISEPSQ